MVMEFCPNGDLEKYLYKQETLDLPANERLEKGKELASQVAAGLAYLHSKGWIHRLKNISKKVHWMKVYNVEVLLSS
jgi:serine/threonine protein kinase